MLDSVEIREAPGMFCSPCKCIENLGKAQPTQLAHAFNQKGEYSSRQEQHRTGRGDIFLNREDKSSELTCASLPAAEDPPLRED